MNQFIKENLIIGAALLLTLSSVGVGFSFSYYVPNALITFADEGSMADGGGLGSSTSDGGGLGSSSDGGADGGGLGSSTSSGGGLGSSTSSGGGLGSSTGDGGGLGSSTSSGGGLGSSTSSGGGLGSSSSSSGGESSSGGPIEAGPGIFIPLPPEETTPPGSTGGGSSSSSGGIEVPPPPVEIIPPPSSSSGGGSSSSSGGIEVPPPPVEIIPPPPPSSSSGSSSSSGGGSSSGAGGSGSGGMYPNVELTRLHGTSPLASFVSVNLGNIPYTGVGDALLTYIFLFVLLVASALFSYGMVYAGGPSGSLQMSESTSPARDRFSRFILSIRDALKPYADLLNPFAPIPRATTLASEAPVSMEEETEASVVSPVISSSLAIRKEVDTPVDLVSQIRALKQAPVAPSVALPVSGEEKERAIEMLMSYAREKEILLAREAATLVLSAADGKVDQARTILAELTEVAQVWYEKSEYSWLSLSAARVREVLFSTYLSMVPMFVRWLATNESSKSSAVLRMLDAQGHSVPEFLKAVAYELDKVHRFRTAREAGANEMSLSTTAGWSLSTLESSITALIGAGDESYSSPLLGARLAISRVMDMASRESKKNLLESGV